MKNLLSVLIVVALVGGICWLFLKIQRRLQDRQVTESREQIANWHLSSVQNNSSFNYTGTYADALTELRQRIPGALVILVDDEMSVIFFSTPSQS